jgi:hypothetical protein
LPGGNRIVPTIPSSEGAGDGGALRLYPHQVATVEWMQGIERSGALEVRQACPPLEMGPVVLDAEGNVYHSEAQVS